MNIPSIVSKDVRFIYNSLTEKEKEKFHGRTILITGFAGSLGYTLLHFFSEYGRQLGIRKVYGIDNYMFGRPTWVKRIVANSLFDLRELDVIQCELEFAKDADVIFHMASLASPVFYRQYPIETMDADVIGLRRLLDFYRNKPLKSFLFYSTSEIYGDPDIIPTPESYWGNVNPCGPRACYDESKRFGETLCYNFAKQFNMPIKIVRPFNNFGPGMRINDQRVTADFAKDIIDNRDIVIYSDGKPTRTLAYIPDATVGYIKVALYEEFEIFNIGSDQQELTIVQLAELFQKVGREVYGYNGKIVFHKHPDKDYLTDNPNRRCPDLTKAKKLLNFKQQIAIEEGIQRYLEYLLQSDRSEFEW
ncbi:NAD-dependent epimerase/dehydratase family protein [Bacillus sp. HMF5848]|uniref:NAD-dependent epimerase/dehydratase family protein n=1 Tax=Bacillus sp. HMF5848 TaxID=2495421 RepID=UPI000F791728|nr:NAD-dependent epimerase/dehydratase family protein [Bacillus sp. HMF5848]RSK28616.1 NAD-dependent epimerase/dehydratase family protein [Bacillus sp. HMF5848]